MLVQDRLELGALPARASLIAKPGSLRLTCVPAPIARNDGSLASNNLYDAPNFLLQKFCAPEFTATTVLSFGPVADGEMAGLAVFGYNYAVLGLRRVAGETRRVLRINLEAQRSGIQESEVENRGILAGPVYLRVTVDANTICRFSYAFDGVAFQPIGQPFQATVDRWVGAKLGLIATAAPGATQTGHADFDWFRVTPPIKN